MPNTETPAAPRNTEEQLVVPASSHPWRCQRILGKKAQAALRQIMWNHKTLGDKSYRGTKYARHNRALSNPCKEQRAS